MPIWKSRKACVHPPIDRMLISARHILGRNYIFVRSIGKMRSLTSQFCSHFLWYFPNLFWPVDGCIFTFPRVPITKYWFISLILFLVPLKITFALSVKTRQKGWRKIHTESVLFSIIFLIWQYIYINYSRDCLQLRIYYLPIHEWLGSNRALNMYVSNRCWRV